MSSLTASTPGVDVSTNDSPIYTLFDVEVTDRLTRDHILRLAAGVVGAVRVRGFSSPEDAAAVMAGLDSRRLEPYDEHLIWPPIAKLGPTAYDYYGAGCLTDDYWDDAARAAASRSTLLGGRDPLHHATAVVAEAWGDDVVPATSGGRPMFAGVIREMAHGVKLHFDEAMRESPGTIDETPASFLTLNWYFSMPARGGETHVYRKRWRPADEVHRDGYGYTEAAVAGEPLAAVRAEAGDALLFDSRNLHAVLPPAGPGRRVGLSFFLGITGRGRLETWS